MKLVMTNGCFDVLHVGHVRYLEAARRLGDSLVVVVNDDESVRSLKGEGRPVQRCEDRAEIIGALRCVDKVIITSEVRLENVIRGIRPDVWAKGGDYTIDTLDQGEVEAAIEVGAEIVLLDKEEVPSTTDIICGIIATNAI